MQIFGKYGPGLYVKVCWLCLLGPLVPLVPARRFADSISPSFVGYFLSRMSRLPADVVEHIGLLFSPPNIPAYCVHARCGLSKAWL